MESLFEGHEAPHEVLMNEEEASSPDIDDLLVDDPFSHNPGSTSPMMEYL